MLSINILKFSVAGAHALLAWIRNLAVAKHKYNFFQEGKDSYFSPALAPPQENSELTSTGKELSEDTPACPCK